MSDCQHKKPNRGPKQGDVQTEGQQVHGKTKEDLIDALADRLSRLTGDTDPAEIEQLLDEIDRFGPVAEDFEVERSLKEFHDKYGYGESGGKAKVKPPRRLSRMARVAIIAAVLFGCVVTAQAAGFDIIGAIAEWTSERFHLITGYENNPKEAPETLYASLQEALDEYGVDVPLSPKKFPEGTELENVSVKELKGVPSFLAEYDISGEKMFISIRQVEVGMHSEVEINDSENAELYVVNGIEHSIATDVKQQKVVWRNGLWECNLTTVLSRDELVAMIDSIYS